jgi:hypothetical protein
MPLQTRYFSFDDVSSEQTWELLEWCHAIGGDEFTEVGLVSPIESQRMKDFFARLNASSIPEAPRRRLNAPSKDAFTRPVPLWRLDESTIAQLKEAMPMGIASREYDTDLWLEDLTVYRDGQFLMGVLSHENGGVIRVTELELSALRRLRFPDRDEVPWVGF